MTALQLTTARNLFRSVMLGLRFVPEAVIQEAEGWPLGDASELDHILIAVDSVCRAWYTWHDSFSELL